MREGIASLLRRAGIEVVAEAGDAEELLRGGRRARARTSRSSTSGCRPTHTDEGAARRARDPRAPPGHRHRDPVQHVEAGHRARILAERPEGSATCSRTASATSTSSPARCGASPPAARALDPRGRLAAARRAAATTARWPALTPREREVLAAGGRGPLEQGRSATGWASASAPCRSTSPRSSTSSACPAGEDDNRRILAVLRVPADRKRPSRGGGSGTPGRREAPCPRGARWLGP